MKYLKNYKIFENNDIEEDEEDVNKVVDSEVPFSIFVTSTVPNDGTVSEEDIKKGVEIAESNGKNLLDEHQANTMRSMKKYTVAIWQVKKGREMRDAFYKNLKIDYTPTDITFTTGYIVNLPKKWEGGNLVEWAEGMHLLHKEFLSQFSLSYIENWTMTEEQKSLYDRLKEFFTKLAKNEKWTLKRGDKILKPSNYTP